MPPYVPVTSKAQSRKLFSLADQGEISLDDAKGKTRAADFSTLPQRVTTPRGKSGKRPRKAPVQRPAGSGR